MSAVLTAKFEKRFRQGATITGDLSQPIDRFSVTVLFGPSGCGKTTVLRSLAGLERPDTGRIEFGNEVWFDASAGRSARPQERGIGFLFQDYALFPHLRVAGNIAYGLRGKPEGERRRIAGEMMERLQLDGLGDRYPAQISGGQAQRVALARVLVRQPRLLLLDEPMSALDAALRERIRGELRLLLEQFRIPVILVTHDRTEAIALGDRMIVMQAGQVRQSGSVHDVFLHPSDASIAHIVGVETIERGEILGVDNGLATVQVGPVTLVAVAPADALKFVHVCIKGEDVTIQAERHEGLSVRNQFPCIVKSIVPEGALVRVGLDCGFELTALITRPSCNELAIHLGQTVFASIKTPAIHLIANRGDAGAGPQRHSPAAVS